MAQVQQQSRNRLDILGAVRRGMLAYDNEYIKLGTVARIYWGAEIEHPDSDDFEATFLGVISLSPEKASLFRQEGCIRVDTGLVTGDYYVLPQQVAYISKGGVFLLLHGDGLMLF
jgi:hypothetical protein